MKFYAAHIILDVRKNWPYGETKRHFTSKAKALAWCKQQKRLDSDNDILSDLIYRITLSESLSKKELVHRILDGWGYVGKQERVHWGFY